MAPVYRIRSLTAVSLYQGPILVRNNFFDKYQDRYWCRTTGLTYPDDCDQASEYMKRSAGAISYNRENNYPMYTSTYVEGNKFGYCDEVSQFVIFI